MSATICIHGRQFISCGDCWNNRCDICGSTLDQIGNDCLQHGKREKPLESLADEKIKLEGSAKSLWRSTI